MGVVDYPSGHQGILLDPKDAHLARQSPADYLQVLEASARCALTSLKDVVYKPDPEALDANPSISVGRLDPKKLERLIKRNAPTAGGRTRIDNSLHSYWIEQADNRYIVEFFSLHGQYYTALFDYASLENSVVAEMAEQHREMLRALLGGNVRAAKPDIFRGCMPALMTPCSKDGTVNYQALVAKGKELIQLGMRSVVYCGSMGEWPLLSDEQRMEGVRHLVEAGIPTIVGTGAKD